MEFVIRKAEPGEGRAVAALVKEVYAAMPEEQKVWFSINAIDEQVQEIDSGKALAYLAETEKADGKILAETEDQAAAETDSSEALTHSFVHETDVQVKAEAEAVAAERQEKANETVCSELCQHLAGVFIAEIPGRSETNLGRHIHFTEEQLLQVAHMDTAAVRADCRGHALQWRLMEAAEADLKARGFRYLMCTVHPDNPYSRGNLVNMGYRRVWQGLKYGGKLRDVMLKEV